jgi:hypothetical protein
MSRKHRFQLSKFPEYEISNLNSGSANLRKLQKKTKLLSDKSAFENLVSLRIPVDMVLILLINESKKKNYRLDLVDWEFAAFPIFACLLSYLQFMELRKLVSLLQIAKLMSLLFTIMMKLQ